MTSVRVWMEMMAAARRLGIPVRQMYDAVDEGRVEARWVGAGATRRLQVALDADSGELTARAG